MKKFFKFILVVLISFTSICNAQDKLTVLLDWFANPNHAPLLVAESKGFFTKNGLDVVLIGPADPSDPPKLVAAHKADIALTYQPQFMEQVDQGLPLIRIGTLIDKPLACLVTLKDGPIQSISDLKGKTIGYSGDTNSVTLKKMLENHHIPFNTVELINVHYDLTQALLTKKVAAVTGMMRNFELIQLEMAGHPGKAFYPEENGVPLYSALIFIAHKEMSQDPRFKRFLLAVKQGHDFLAEHPEAAWQSVIAKHPELNDELNRKAWFLTVNYFAKDPVAFDKAQWLMFGNFLLKNGLVKKVQPIQNYIVRGE